MASLTGGLGGRNSISTNIVSPLIVKQSDRTCEFFSVLGIESYQTKINLERPNWDAADYYFKEDYTIVPKPRAVVYRDKNDQRKLMRLNELHKFSDGTLTRVMEKLDQMVKDFHLYEYNKGMETRKWSEDDKRRSKDFITAIEKRLQIRKSRKLHPSETIVFHNEDGNPARANIKQALGYRKDGDRDGKSEFLRCQVVFERRCICLFDLAACHLVEIMSPRMMTRSVGLATATPRGGRTGGRTGRGGGRTRGRSGDLGNGGIDGQGGQVGGQGAEVNDNVDEVPDFSTIIAQQLYNLLPTILAQVGNQGRNQGNGRNQNGDAVNDNIRGNVRNVIENNEGKGCTYKEFLDMSRCKDSQKVKYTAGSLLVRLLRGGTLRSTHEVEKPLLAGTLTNEAVSNGSLKKNPKKRRNRGESSRDRNVKYENKRTRTGNAFATATNSVRREYNGTIPKCVSYNLHHPSEIPCRDCFNCGRLGHMTKDCRVAPRIVNLVNARNPTVAPGACYECEGTDNFKAACPRLNQAQRLGGNRPNQVVANNEGQGRRNNGNQARGRAFMLGVEEAHQDPNIMTGTFTLNDHYATTLFDFDSDYSFISNTFIPLLGIEPSDLGFSYEIVIASGQLVEIDKVIRGCKLEIQGLPHIREIEFRIKLIPRAIPVVKSPYRLAPSEMEEVSGQLKELQDKGFIRPSSSP
ncbi:reverse transcriptase domain-containing protein [Tanacetum coccineum]|uniref:Reverse transcriptase domain-containing protein n=1 Tax=Tanacetum coccineum TaxID=301880 RepID=A0ABQ4Y9T9_9ASTR